MYLKHHKHFSEHFSINLLVFFECTDRHWYAIEDSLGGRAGWT